MSKSSWAEMENDPEFKQLSPEDQKAIKQHYAETEMVNDPEFKALSPEDQKAVLSEFLGESADLPETDGQNHYTFGQALAEMPSHIIPSTGKFLEGLWGAVTHPVETAQTLWNLPASVGTNAADMIVPGSKEAWLKAHPEDKAGVDAATGIGQSYADRYGNWDSIKRTIAEDPASIGADVATIFGGAGAGARLAGAATAAKALDGVASAANPINWATAVPKVIADKTGVTAAAGKLGHKVMDSFIVPENLNPMAGPIKGPPGPTKATQNALLMDATAGREQATLNALNRATEHVPGVRSTAADAIANDGVATKLQALAKGAEDVNPDEFTAREYANNAARLADLDQIGRTHSMTDAQLLRAGFAPGAFNPSTATVPELEAAKEAARTNNYGPLNTRPVTADSVLVDILSRPSGANAIEIARQIAKEEGRDFPDPVIPASTTTSPVVGPHGMPVTTTTPASYTTYQGQDLMRLKKAFDRLAYSKELRAKYSIDDEAAKKIIATKEAYLNWLEDNSRLPEHRTAREDHAAWNNLLDRRQAADVFKEALTGALSGDEQATQRANIFANLFDSPKNAVNGNRNVKKATDFGRYTQWADLLTPNEMAVLSRNKADLSRMAQAEAQARKGKSFKGKLTNSADVPQAPGLLRVGVTVGNALARGLMAGVNGKVANNLAKAAETPRGLANAMDDAIKRKAQMDRVHARNKKAGNALKRTAPATNAMNDARRKRIEAENAEILRHL